MTSIQVFVTAFTAFLAFNCTALANDSVIAQPVGLVFESSSVVADAEIAIESNALTQRGSYFNWGRGRDGFGYCYEWTRNGQVLNGGQPVPEHLCERRNPSYFEWARARNGWGNCYRFTPYGVVMNQGQPQSYGYCEQSNPSYFDWARSQSGHYYCYQFGNGLVLNDGRPVPNHYCR